MRGGKFYFAPFVCFCKGAKKVGQQLEKRGLKGYFLLCSRFLKDERHKQFLKATDVTSHVRKNWWSKREKRAFVE